MDQISYYYLILRYPTLRQYINTCFVGHHDDQLIDFIFGLETDEESLYV